MTDSTTGDASSDSRDNRSSEVESSPGSAAWLIWSMIVLGSIVAIGSILNVWVRAELLDTDAWVEAADQLLENDDVRLALSTFLVDELYEKADAAGGFEDQLPDGLKGLAGPVSAAFREPATNAVDRLLDTEQVRAIWSAANRVAHQALVAVLRGDIVQGVSGENGALTLDLGDLLHGVGTRLGLPDSVMDRLPDDAGQIVIVESSKLATAQQAVRVIEFMSVALFILVVALYAGAVYLAKDRRRVTLRNVGWALALSGLVVLVSRRIAVQVAVDQLAGASNVRSAGRAVALIGTQVLNDLAWAGVAIGVLIAVYAILIGPWRAAVATRDALAPLLANTAAIWATSIVLLLILLAVFPSLRPNAWVPLLVFAVLFIAAVESLRRQTLRENPQLSSGDR